MIKESASPPEITFVRTLIYGTWAPNTRQNGAYNIEKEQRGKGATIWEVHNFFDILTPSPIDLGLQNLLIVGPQNVGASNV